MPDVPDAIYLLMARPTNYGTSDAAYRFRIYDSWLGAEVLGYFTVLEHSEKE